MSFLTQKPVGIFYEHPVEFNALARDLKSRDIPVVVINPTAHDFSPGDGDVDYSLILNDLSTPTGMQRDGKAIRQRLHFVTHLELNHIRFSQGRIINGSSAIETFVNRSRQLSVFSSLNMPFPKTRIVNSLDRLIAILPEFSFPIIIKPNDAWKQLPVLRFDTLSELIDAVVKNRLAFADDLLLVQEYLTPKNDSIIRVDTINGRVVAARKIYTGREPLPLWPIELKAEFFWPSEEITEAVESIVRAARVDVGAVEYFVDRKSNTVMFYSIRPQSSSHVAVSGSTPGPLVEYLERRLSKIREVELSI